MTSSLLALALAFSPPTLFNASPPTASGSKVTLTVGQQKILNFPGLTRIAIGDSSIFDVHVQPNGEVLVLGKALGRTTFISWVGSRQTVHQVEVTDTRASDLSKLIHALPGMEGVRVEEYGGTFVLQGMVDSDADLDKINKVLEGGPSAKNLVKVERRAEEQVVEKINNAFRKAGLRNAQAVRVGGEIFLEGQVEDPTDLHRAELIANSLAGNEYRGQR